MSYLTLSSERVRELPSQNGEELREWLRGADLNPEVVTRVTLDTDRHGSVTAYVTEVELDESSPYISHTRVLTPGRLPVLPTHLRAFFRRTDELL